MKLVNNLILQDRENRQRIVKAIIDEGDSVVTLKANIPGLDKSINIAYLLIQYYRNILSKHLSAKPSLHEGYDGPTLVYRVKPSASLKQQMMDIEEQTPLGRFIDIDVYQNAYQSERRTVLRKCYLCDFPAIICNKKQAHTPEELLAFMENSVYQELKNIISNTIKKSMMLELDIHPKFGLVTPYSQGSHPDMDYYLMQKAQDIIIPYLGEMFIKGLQSNDLSALFTECRAIGVKAEQAMFQGTGNINAYKGLIFSLGLALASGGHCFSKRKQFNEIFSTIQTMTIGIMQELKTPPKSFGVLAYQQYGIGGARYEAAQGYPLVQELLKQNISFELPSLTMLLIKIISSCNDTVLLKRSGSIEKYHYYKQLVASITEYDIDKITEVTALCINHKISFGGSADLLVVTIFLKLIKIHFFE